MRKIYEAPKQAEQDRSDAQRKALSTLLARFTADRDLLISSIQECQQQIAALAAKIDTTPDSPQRLEKLSEAVTRLESEQRRFAAAPSGRDLAATVARVQEVAAQERRATVGSLQSELRSLLQRVDDLHGATGSQLESLREQMAHMQEAHEQLQHITRERLEEVLRRSEEAAGRVEAVASDAVRGEELVDVVRRLAVEDQAARETLQAAQRHLNELVTQIEAAQGEVAPQVDALRNQIDTLQDAVAEAEREAQSVASDALARAEELTRRLESLAENEQAHRGQAVARISQLSDAQETLAAAVAQYRDDVDRASTQWTHAQQEQARTLEKQLVAAQVSQQELVAQARRLAEQACAQAAEAARKVEEMFAAHETHGGADLGELSRRLDVQDAAAAGRDERIVALATAIGNAEKRHREALVEQQVELRDGARAIEERSDDLQHAVAALSARFHNVENAQAVGTVQWNAQLSRTQDSLEALATHVKGTTDSGDQRWEELRLALDALATRIAGIEAAGAGRTGEVDRHVAELQALVAQINIPLPDVAAAPEWRQLRADLRTIGERVDRSDAERTATSTQWQAQVNELRQVVSELVARADARVREAAPAHDVHEIRASLDTLSTRLNVLEHDRPAEEERWRAVIAELREQIRGQQNSVERFVGTAAQLEGIAQQQSRLSSLVESVGRAQATADDALRRTEVLDGAQAASLDALRQQIANLAEEGAALRSTVQAHGDSLHRGQPAQTGASEPPETLRASLQSATAQLERRVEAINAQAGALAERFGQMAAEQRKRDEDITGVLTTLSNERDNVNAAIRKQAEELSRLLGRLPQHPANDPVIENLQARIAELAAAIDDLRQEQRASAQPLAAGGNGEPIRELRAAVKDLRSISTRLEHDADVGRRQLEDVQAGLERERSERLHAEASTRTSLHDVSEHMAQAIQVVERTLAGGSTRPGSAATSATADPITTGLSRVEARLEQLLTASVRTTAVAPATVTPTTRGARWPLVLLALFGFITAASAVWLVVSDLRRVAPVNSNYAARVPIAELDDPTLAAQFAQGLGALQRGDLATAERAFREVVAARPDSAEARNNLAAVLVEQRLLDAATDQLREALRLRPDYERARTNLTRVERLKGSSSRAEQPKTNSVVVAPDSSPNPATSNGGAQSNAAKQAIPPQAAAAPSSDARCTVDTAEQRVCCTTNDGTGQICFALAATPTRNRRPPAKSKAKPQVDDEDLDLLYDLP